MISLELARKLKDAGLVQRVLIGDEYYKDITDPEVVWMPYLHQLLAEIERRGWRWDMFIGNGDKYAAWLIRGDDVGYVVAYEVTADTPEDAAGLALLHVLRSDINESR